MRFDVLDEACVPVIYTGSAKVVDVSIYKLFEDSHLISSIYTNSVMEEYGIKRILVAFFMDAFKPKDNTELKKLLDVGHFDMSVIDVYVSNCRSLGDVFNLFDDKLPFLQLKNVDISKYTKDDEQDFVSLWWDAGNVLDSEFEKHIEPKDIFRALCAYNVFLPDKIGRGYPPNINGSAPWYLWIKGDNLFTELIYNSISEEEWRKSKVNFIQQVKFPYAEDSEHFGTHWTTDKTLLTNTDLTTEYKQYRTKFSATTPIRYLNRAVNLGDKGKIDGYATISLLEGLTYQGKGFLVKPDLDACGGIKSYKLYYEPVYKFSNVLKQWRDPFCIYRYGKEAIDGVFSLKPKQDNFTWVGLYSVLYGEAAQEVERPLILNKFGGFSLLDVRLKRELRAWKINGDLKLIAYGAKSNGGKYLWSKREFVTLNATLFELDKQKWYKKALDDIDTVVKVYRTNEFVKACHLDFTSFYLDTHSTLDGQFTSDLLATTNEEEVLHNFLVSRLNFLDNLFERSFKMLDITKKFKDKDGNVISTYSKFYNERNKLRSIANKKLDL